MNISLIQLKCNGVHNLLIIEVHKHKTLFLVFLSLFFLVNELLKINKKDF